jgi:thiamine-monophosphate kinase
LWGADAVVRAATAGDDYEIAFTAPEEARAGIMRAAEETGVPVHEIGFVEEGEGVILRDGEGRPIPIERAGFTHF